MISVIIPLYNKEQTIVHTLKTVLAQTFTDFEVVIVNDGSTDNGVDAIQSNYTDARIRIIHQKNAGVSAARNSGVKEAKSDWVTFLDADDEWQPEYLETIQRLILKYPYVNFMGTAGFFKNAVTGTISPNVISRFAGKEVEINYYLNPDKMSHIGATAIRRTTFLSAGGFPEGIWCSEDVCLMLKLGLTSNYVYCGRPLHVYVGGVSGQVTASSQDKKVEMRRCEGRVYSEIYSLYSSNNQSNRLVPIFLKYKLRGFYYSFLRHQDYVSISAMNDNLSPSLKKLLGTYFIRNITSPSLQKIFIFYILLTKVRWRLYGFPVVGEKIENPDLWVNSYKPA